jgi:hypothetical protein
MTRRKVYPKWRSPDRHVKVWQYVDEASHVLGSVQVGNIICRWSARRGERVLGQGACRSLPEAKRQVESIHKGKN